MGLFVRSEDKGTKPILMQCSPPSAIIRNLPCGNAPSEAAKAAVDALMHLRHSSASRTITTDNEPRFADRGPNSNRPQPPAYCTGRYPSQQKGLNKNALTHIQQPIPRDDNIPKLTDGQGTAILHMTNLRSRIKLGFSIPFQEFYQSLPN